MSEDINVVEKDSVQLPARTVSRKWEIWLGLMCAVLLLLCGLTIRRMAQLDQEQQMAAQRHASEMQAMQHTIALMRDRQSQLETEVLHLKADASTYQEEITLLHELSDGTHDELHALYLPLKERLEKP